MNRYRSLRDAPELDANKGDVLELDLSAADEQGMLDAKRLEIVPREYRVIGSSVVHDTEPDGKFEAALLVEHEATLVAGGHIERTDKPTSERKKEAKP